MYDCYSRLLAFMVGVVLGCSYPRAGTCTKDLSQTTLVIEGATIIDGTGNPPMPDGIVMIENGRIRVLGQRGHVRIPEGAVRVDGRGKWMIPGLIDMHVHIDEVLEPGEFLL